MLQCLRRSLVPLLSITAAFGCSDGGDSPASPVDSSVNGPGAPMETGGTMGDGGGEANTGSGGGTAMGTGGGASGGAASGGLGSGGFASGGLGTGGATGGAASGGAAGSGGASSSGGADGSGGASSVCEAPAGSDPVTIYVIGDSTASEYGSDVYPRMGWGQVLGDYYSDNCATVNDAALSGRSSKSFYDEGAWTPVKNAMQAGDFVIIQFGHNDEKSDDPSRYTEPSTTYKQHLTIYIDDTRAKQATPILATSIPRNAWNGSTMNDTHGAYLTAVRELAEDLDVDLVDLADLGKTYFESIGPDATSDLFMNLGAGEYPNYPSGNSDNTHLREAGARVIAQLFNEDAYAQGLSVAAHLGAIPMGP